MKILGLNVEAVFAGCPIIIGKKNNNKKRLSVSILNICIHSEECSESSHKCLF